MRALSIRKERTQKRAKAAKILFGLLRSLHQSMYKSPTRCGVCMRHFPNVPFILHSFCALLFPQPSKPFHQLTGRHGRTMPSTPVEEARWIQRKAQGRTTCPGRPVGTLKTWPMPPATSRQRGMGGIGVLIWKKDQDLQLFGGGE